MTAAVGTGGGAGAGTSRFDGKVAVVTGAGAGAGRATALRLAAEGAAVVAGDIRGDAAAETAELVLAVGGQALAWAVDVSDEVSVAALMAGVVERFGRLDVLDNNAAILTPDVHGRDVAVADLELEIWDRTFAVNARGTMLCCKHAIGPMRATGGGAIVNIASVSALLGDNVRSAYGSSKAAVVALTRYVATMYGAAGIRCNCVAPGLIMTETALRALSTGQLEHMAAERILPWPAEPEDIAAAVAWLASDEARCITGQTVLVDGGTTAHRPGHVVRTAASGVSSGD
jgi:NAD(P)-dependent dehydrogenase (short-subunit alcohol dehydrogenase family)